MFTVFLLPLLVFFSFFLPLSGSSQSPSAIREGRDEAGQDGRDLGGGGEKGLM